MAVEIVHFLMGKFTDSLQLQGEDHTEVLFEQRFRELKWELEKRISPAMPLDKTNLLRELLYDLNDILVECRTMSTKHSDRRRHRRGECISCCSLRDLWFRCRTKKRLRRIMQSVRTISSSDSGDETAVDVNIIARRDGIGKGKSMEFDRWTSPTVGYISKVHGFSEQALEVEKLLVKQGGKKFTALGIVGMGGVGKTSLAQAVFNSPNVRRYFNPRLWVCMSQTSESGKDTRKEAVERVLMLLGIEEEVIRSAAGGGMSGSQSLAVLTFMLHLQLLGKRYLIVFDDMWSTDEWYEGLDRGSPGDGEWGDRLAYGLPKSDGGGVIVTGRIEAAVKGMAGEGDTRLLLPLESREACWSIFMDAYAKRAGLAANHAALREMEAEITDKCCGLPLAARTMGEIMAEMASSSDGSSRGCSSSNVSSSTNSGSLQ